MSKRSRRARLTSGCMFLYCSNGAQPRPPADLTTESTTGGPESPCAPGDCLVNPARKGNAVGVTRTLFEGNTICRGLALALRKMNKCKNNDESVIFQKINRGKLPDFHETSFHVSSSSGRSWREVLGSVTGFASSGNTGMQNVVSGWTSSLDQGAASWGLAPVWKYTLSPKQKPMRLIGVARHQRRGWWMGLPHRT